MLQKVGTTSKIQILIPYNQPVDIYGVGIVMYVLLSGQVPFQIETDDHRDILAINASN